MGCALRQAIGYATQPVQRVLTALDVSVMPSRSAIVLCALVLSGCATLPDGKGWGEQATVAPGWERVRESAVNAAKDPWTWGPLIGAAAFQIDDFDRRTSDWARDHTPVFGSQHSAEQWSDDLRSASSIAN